MRQSIDVVKLDVHGVEKIRYKATPLVLDFRWGYALVEAHFALDRADVELFTLEHGDRMLEHFWSSRHFNIFEIYSPGGLLRGFYCNITRPAVIDATSVAAEDLALDLVVDAAGNTMQLDIDEFRTLSLNDDERRRAIVAIEELELMAHLGVGPFYRLHGGHREAPR